MIHKWMEQWFDTFLFLVLMAGMLLGFQNYWRSEFQIRYAEVIMQDFLTEVSGRGKITRESLDALVSNLEDVNPDYSVMLEGTRYVIRPVYAQIPQEYISKYFAERNQTKNVMFQEYQLQVPEEAAENLRLQKETNALLLAAESAEYLPLPTEDVVWEVEAVRPSQEVYEKESLLTLCRVTSENGSFFTEAETVCAEQSGIVFLNLQLEGKNYQAPVEVLCYPRTIKCRYGHEVVNTESVLREYNLTGVVRCPYCRELPKQLTASSFIIYKKTGNDLNRADVYLTIEYMDGHTETITPDSLEWQDSYDKNFCGMQQVEVRYRGETFYFTVVSENENCEQCGGSCNDRCYTDYHRFPYCVNCLGEQEVFTCEFYEEEQQISQKELFSELAQTQEVCFLAGDFVALRLMSRGRFISLLQRKIRRDGEGNTE